jgi:hypothetical protein
MAPYLSLIFPQDLETHNANPYLKQFPKFFGPFLDRQRPMRIFYNNELDSTIRAKS